MSKHLSPSEAADPESGGPVGSQRRLLQRLGPDSFPHAVGRISVIETHISFVVLTGHFAYKIKKALKLGFLDFSGLERRRFYCDEELRLNRRLAAPLYLEVVALGGGDEGLRWGGAGPVLEYAVRMVEFEQGQLMDRLLARGEVEAGDIDALARQVADFHRRLPRAQTLETQGYGRAQAVADPVLANFAELRPLLGAEAQALDDLEAWSRREFAVREAALAGRHRDGWIRECHGDLHLGNVVRLAEGPCIFDCIEFNPAFRWIDVVSEIAFLVMDLSERGRPDFGFRFLNAYLEQSGDWGGLVVLRFYVVYRAMVRAKVAAIRAGQAARGSAERVEAMAGCRAYIELARGWAAPPVPVLFIMHGLSGSGKTWVSQRLLEAVPAVRFRSDVERKRLHGLAPLEASRSGLGDGLYGPSANAATYEYLRDRARGVLQAGFSVVVDASFLRRWQRDLFRELAGELGVPLVIVHCEAAASVLSGRLAQREQAGGDASEAGEAVLSYQRRTADALAADEPAVDLEGALAGGAWRG